MDVRFSSLLLLPVLAAVACSSPSADETPTVSIDALSTNADAGPAPIDCKATATQGECVACVSNANGAGAAVYRGLVLQAFCADDVCHADCATTLCAATAQNPNAACSVCASGAQQEVAQPVLEACSADASCRAFAQALTDAQCAVKPAS
jgi:hypothetical protein